MNGKLKCIIQISLSRRPCRHSSGSDISKQDTPYYDNQHDVSFLSVYSRTFGVGFRIELGILYKAGFEDV